MVFFLWSGKNWEFKNQSFFRRLFFKIYLFAKLFLFYLFSIIFVFCRCKVYYIDLGSIEFCHNQEIFKYSQIFEVCRDWRGWDCNQRTCFFQNWKRFFIVKNVNERKLILRYCFFSSSKLGIKHFLWCTLTLIDDLLQVWYSVDYITIKKTTFDFSLD